MDRFNSLNFVPLFKKSFEEKKEEETKSYKFIPNVKSSPKRTVYKRVNHVQYVRVIHNGENNEK